MGGETGKRDNSLVICNPLLTTPSQASKVRTRSQPQDCAWLWRWCDSSQWIVYLLKSHNGTIRIHPHHPNLRCDGWRAVENEVARACQFNQSSEAFVLTTPHQAVLCTSYLCLTCPWQEKWGCRGVRDKKGAVSSPFLYISPKSDNNRYRGTSTLREWHQRQSRQLRNVTEAESAVDGVKLLWASKGKMPNDNIMRRKNPS